MAFLKVVRRRSFISEASYIFLNIALVISILVLINLTGSPWLSIGLVILSKWRVFAVRARYWIVNLQSNLVDYIVSISFVLFLYSVYSGNSLSGQKLAIVSLLMVVYMAWLIFVRPRSKRIFIVTQAGVALFSGAAILYSVAYALPLSITVISMWVIGYSTAKHVLASYNEESHATILSQIWGLILAEMGWIAYHWTIAYSLLGAGSIMIPRIALTVICVGFVAYKCYDSFYHYEKIRPMDVVLPIVFTFGIIVVLPIVLSLMGTGVAIGI